MPNTIGGAPALQFRMKSELPNILVKPSATQKLQAGVAKREISPQKPIFLVGYPHVPRISTGIHDPLYASALYLDYDGEAIILIAVDILVISHETVRTCRTAITQTTGVPAKNILISATHTHSGPNTSEILMWKNDPVVPPPDPDYMRFFTQSIIEAAMAAKTSAVPCRLAITDGEAYGVGRNRLSPDGIMDYQVGILFVQRTSDRSPLALAMIYGMHPTVLHEDSKLVSSDFPHYTRREIEERLPGITVLYHNGTCGNLSLRYDVQGQTFAEAERLGRTLGRTVLSAIEKLKESDFHENMTFSAIQDHVTLPIQKFPSESEAKATLEKAWANYNRLKVGNTGHASLRTAECIVFGAEEAVVLARAQVTGELETFLKKYRAVEVQVLRLGKTFVVGLPGELFVEYGLEIKRCTLGNYSFAISMANGGLQGYIVTPEAAKVGGYEAALAIFSPESGAILVNTAIGLMKRMRGGAKTITQRK